MSRRLLTGLVPIAVAASLSFVPAASAATQIGDPCLANYAVDDTTIFQQASPSTGLPAAAPSSGVITKWVVNVSPTSATIPQVLKVVRVLGPTTAQTVAESPQENAIAGFNQFAARLPIAAGDRLGLYGAGDAGTLLCDAPTTGADKLGYFPGSPPIGVLSPFAEVAKQRLPVVATIEPDVDADGYGDETQDGCPQSAAVQIPCPAVTVDATSRVGANAATVLVRTSSDAVVKVIASVKLGKDGKAKLSARAKPVAPGKRVTFALKFPGKLKQKLEELGPKQKLTLKITASATNVAGQLSTDKLKVKLKGQG